MKWQSMLKTISYPTGDRSTSLGYNAKSQEEFLQQNFASGELCRMSMRAC